MGDFQESYNFDPDHDPNRDRSIRSLWGEVPGPPHERLQVVGVGDNIIKYKLRFWPGYFTNHDKPNVEISKHVAKICNHINTAYELLESGDKGIIILFDDSLLPLEIVYPYYTLREDGISGKYLVSQLASAEAKDKVYRFFFHLYFGANQLDVKDTQKIIKKQFQEYRSEITRAKSYHINEVMKQPTGAEFDRAFKTYFDKLLKPLGFKRKGRAYYRVMNDQIIQAFHCYKNSRFDWTPRLSLLLLCDNYFNPFWLSHGNNELHEFDPRWSSPDVNLRMQTNTSYQFGGYNRPSMEETFDMCANIITQYALPELDKVCNYESAFNSTNHYQDFSPRSNPMLAVLYGAKPGDLQEAQHQISVISEANINKLEALGYKIRSK